MHKVISVLFESIVDADVTLTQLDELGYASDDISIITKEGNIKIEHDTAQGVKDAVTAGGLVGGVVGLVAGITALAIPGIGPLLLAGPIVAWLGITGAAATTASGLVTGALVGGLLGALKELGIDSVQAKIIEDRVKNGDTLMLIHPGDEDTEEIREILESNNGKHIVEFDRKDINFTGTRA